MKLPVDLLPRGDLRRQETDRKIGNLIFGITPGPSGIRPANASRRSEHPSPFSAEIMKVSSASRSPPALPP